MITVTNTNDAGAGSLRAAIAAAALGEEIVFSVTGTINLTTGELVIVQDVIISGPGFSFLTIATTHAQRIFNITGGVVTITGLTMSGGNPIFDPNGGNLRNEGTLTMSGCVIRAGQAVDGGGIYNLGSITADNCLLNFNGCTTGGSGRGGAIWNDGTLIMSFCNIDSNNVNGGAPTLGGAIWNDGTVTATYCSITNNTCIGPTPMGGGVYSEGTVTLSKCTIDSNLANSNINGGTIQGGGIASQFGTLTVEFSTVSNNQATGFGFGSGDAQGGGIYTAQGNSTYINSSTVSSNQCIVVSGTTTGGAVWMDAAGAVQFNNSTIVQNSSGIYVTFGVTCLPYDSIIAGNTSTDIEGNQPGLDAFTSQGHNIFGTQTVPYIAGAGDLIRLTFASLFMGSLAMNGGTTLTHALLSGSPAIDAGDNTSAPATDQRGGPRIINSTIDIGSFESARLVEFCVDAGTYCQTLTNPTQDQIDAAQAAVNAQALADAEAQAGAPTACCIPPAFTTESHTETLASGTTRYSFAATSGLSLSFWSTSQDGDFGLKLYDTDGITELYRDSAPEEDQRGYLAGGTTAQPRTVAGITYSFTVTGTYFIDVECYGLGGTYTLRICSVDQPGSTVGDPALNQQYASCYAPSTKKFFTASYSRIIASQDALVNVFDAYSLTLINAVPVSKHGFATGVTQILFYNVSDNSVWVLARIPSTGVSAFVRLDPTTGLILETFTTTPATSPTISIGIYCPENNKLYVGFPTDPLRAHFYDAGRVFDCTLRTWGPAIPISGITIGASNSFACAYDSISRKFYAFVDNRTYDGTVYQLTIDTTTDTGTTTTLAHNFTGTYPILPVVNGLVWGVSIDLNRIVTLDPTIGAFTPLEWIGGVTGYAGAFVYDPCRNCMVICGSAQIYFENLPFPFNGWGVAYMARISLVGTWIESAIVDMVRIGNSPDVPIWVHGIWNPVTSRVSMFSTATNFQV